jgi:hypothetical protein
MNERRGLGIGGWGLGASEWGLALLLACAAALAAGCSGKETATNAPPQAAPAKASPLSLTRSVTIPAAVVPDPATVQGNPGALTLSEGGDDELPEGPTTFDVLSDGGFVIADPLRQRLVFYDSSGKFRFDLLIHFPAERVRALPYNALSVVRYQTGERYIYQADSAGQYQPPRLAAANDPDPDAADAGVAKLETRNLATVNAVPSPNTETVPVPVRFDAVGEEMVSVRRLGLDARLRTYVAIEAAFPGQRVDARTIVRKYTGQGEPLIEIADIPLDYFAHPVDEFRMRDGILYQLMPKASEVRINMWDTNSRP